QKHQFGALLLAIDNRRRVLGAPRDKAHFRGQAAFATVATYVDNIPVFDGREYCLRREKTKLEIPRRQYCDNRPSCRHGLAWPVINLLHRAVTGTIGVATHQPRLRPVKIGFSLTQRSFSVVICFLCSSGGLQQFLCTIEALLCIYDSCISYHDVGLLQVVVYGEKHVAFVHAITFANLQCLHPPLLIGRNENQFGLDPALQHAVIGLAAAAEYQRGEHNSPEASELCSHVALLGANNSSTWVSIILRTSSGSNRSNRPLQTIATNPGAATICG